MWPVTLSGRLPVDALVSHNLTNKLIGRESIHHRKNFPTPTMQQELISGISTSFPALSRSDGQVTHVLLTRSPLVYPRKGLTVRLACVKHAASVRPEPGSNSPMKKYHQPPPTTTGSSTGNHIKESKTNPNKPTDFHQMINRNQSKESINPTHNQVVHQQTKLLTKK